MESFTLTGANGWQLLSTLLLADATFKGRFLWNTMTIHNGNVNAMIVKNLPGSTAPSTDSGVNLDLGDAQTWNGALIDGRAVWIKCAGGGTLFDITFTPHRGAAAQ